MKKLFLLIPALALSLLANAADQYPDPSVENSLSAAVIAVGDGETIYLDDATPYFNVNGVDYTKLRSGKHITFRAIEGKHPVIKYEVPFQVREAVNAKFIGVKFDGTNLSSSYDNYFHLNDAAANVLEFEDCEFYNSSKYIVSVPASTKANSLVFKNCKFYNNSTNRGILNQGNIGRLELDGCEVSNFVKEFIHGYSGTSHVDECVVNDCYFHDNSRSSIMFVASTVDGTQTCDQLTVTNSTFANIDASGEYESVIDIRPYGTAVTDAIQVLVDHCTFYNNTVINSDHANIRTAYLSDVTVSNCIFYYPSKYATRATYCTGGGNINNCLTYNYTAEGTKGHAYGATVNAASIVADPLFNDLANNKYTYAGEYGVSMSPARGAGTDGSDLGDPRWYTEIVYPTTDFATPYAFVAEDAELEGGGSQFLLETSVTPNYIRYADKADPGTATWYFTATRECYVQVTLNLADNTVFYTNNKHILEVQLYEGNNLLGSVAEGPAWEGDGFTENGVDKTLTGHLHIPAAGNYSVKLLNNRHNSKTGIYGVTFTYEGGALVNLPAVAIPFEDAILNGATRDGDGIHFGAVDRYAEWNVAATAGLYTFTFDVVGSNYGHYQLTIIDSESNTIYDNYKGQSASGSVTHSSIYLDGNYTIRVANTNPGADGYITSIAATAASDIFVLDENTMEDGSVAAKDEAHWRLMLRRTFTAGKYYSICIPIDSYDDELTSVFGTGYELWKMESATQNGEEVSLNFTQITNGDFFAGTPYLIKPAQDVANPTFSSHTIHNSTYNNVKSFAAADFVGSFYKTEIPAGENNLYLQNNNLYYSETNDTPIKGTRAWIRLKPQGPNYVKARIVLGPKVVTSINLVNGELLEGTVKTIENGQLVIIRDGVKYNAMGIKLQ